MDACEPSLQYGMLSCLFVLRKVVSLNLEFVKMVKATTNRGNGRVYGLGFRDEVIMIAARQSGTSTRDACKF